MSPKDPAPVPKSDNLEKVDSELESAMEHLSKTNEDIENLLANLEEPEGDLKPDDESGVA